MSPLYLIQGVSRNIYGLSLAALASILLLARVFDAVTDPIIGYWSDRQYRLIGTRKPFVFVGGLMLVVVSYFLYVPIGTVEQSVSARRRK